MSIDLCTNVTSVTTIAPSPICYRRIIRQASRRLPNARLERARLLRPTVAVGESFHTHVLTVLQLCNTSWLNGATLWKLRGIAGPLVFSAPLSLEVPGPRGLAQSSQGRQQGRGLIRSGGQSDKKGQTGTSSCNNRCSRPRTCHHATKTMAPYSGSDERAILCYQVVRLMVCQVLQASLLQ